MATVKRFEDLEIWQLARELALKVFQLTKKDKLSKDYKLKDQMNASAGAIMDNIAEGFGRGSRLEFVQFLSVSNGSADELKSQLYRCIDKEYIIQDEFNPLYELTDKIFRKINSRINYLNKSDVKGQKFKNRNEITDKRSVLKTTNDKRQTINKITTTENAARPLGSYPHTKRVGNLLFLSGIGSRNPKDNSVPGLALDTDGNIIHYDIEAECHSVFANVKAVLEASGSSWDKIVDVTVFLTNMKKDFPVYNKIYNEYFKDVQACRTTIEVKSLPTLIAIELKVIATID
ncbi:MAG TPA: four helix bundle protein [Chitinophagaceae bacterium]|nr:four helix bundle protein [Chitinophagaceae bacterium]